MLHHAPAQQALKQFVFHCCFQHNLVTSATVVVISTLAHPTQACCEEIGPVRGGQLIKNAVLVFSQQRTTPAHSPSRPISKKQNDPTRKNVSSTVP